MQSKSKPTRIIAIDYGMVRIGLAYSDERKIIATPLITLRAEKKSEQTVVKLLQELERHQKVNGYEIEEIIVGMPLLMSGKMGLSADEVNHFVLVLKQAITIPVTLWDERLTTVQAERSMREGGMTRKQRSKVVDTVSAVILLQNYLDFKHFRNESQL